MTDVVFAPRVIDPETGTESVVTGGWLRVRPTATYIHASGGQVLPVWRAPIALSGSAETLQLDPLPDVPYEYELTCPDGNGGRYITREYRIVPSSGTPVNWEGLTQVAGPFGGVVDLPSEAEVRLDEVEAAAASKVDKGSLVYNVKDYGALGTYNGSTGSDDTAAILAAVADLQAKGVGGTIYFPPRPSGQRYRCLSSLPWYGGIRYAGQNRKTTRVQFTGFDVFTASSGNLSEMIIEGLYISVSGGHFVNMTGSASFFYNVVRDCMINMQSGDKSILYQNGSGDVLENYWLNIDAYRPATSTAPGFDIKNSAGGANANVWKRFRANSLNTTGSPYWRIEATANGTYAYDNTFEDIVGEQNPGGLIHLLSNNGAHIRNCYDWDATTDYTDHVIRIDKSATNTSGSRAITISNSGRRGGTLGPGIYDAWASGDSRQILMNNVGNHTTTPVIRLPDRAGQVNLGTGQQLAVGDTFTTGRDTTANRPAAATVGAGAMFYDTTMEQPIWSNGSVWATAGNNSVANTPTGELGQTHDRFAAVTGQTISSGRLFLTAIYLRAGEVVTAISYYSAATALVTGTHGWAALFNSSRVPLMQSADDTGITWAANTKKTFTLSSPQTISTSGWYYFGLCVVASTVPSMAGQSPAPAVATASPNMGGGSTSGLTDTAPDPAAAPSTVVTSLYATYS